MKFACAPLLFATCLLAACGTKPPAALAEESKEAEKAEKAEQAEKAANADPNELSQEELDLLAADPKSLGPEQNRKRAYALRKKIMQNPDSAAAKALEDARQSALAGELRVDDKPKEDNGVVIPAPDYLRSDIDQSRGAPAK